MPSSALNLGVCPAEGVGLDMIDKAWLVGYVPFMFFTSVVAMKQGIFGLRVIWKSVHLAPAGSLDQTSTFIIGPKSRLGSGDR